MTPPTQVESTGAKILLVGANAQHLSTQAIMLSRHGYHVETAANVPDASARRHLFRPDLVMLDLSDSSDGTFGLWQSIRDSDPAQRIGFLLGRSQILCRVFLNGELILRREGSEDVIERVQTLLAGG